jgi:hypothetical protein
MAKVTDNYYTDFPARMSDGRFITDYSPNCQQNSKIQQNMTSWQYSLYLKRNSNSIMNIISDENNKKYGCNNCNDPSIPLQNKYTQSCTTQACNITFADSKGLGLN